MNKAQKRLVSALAAATSVAAAIAPAATVFAATKDEAKALVDNAKKTLAFVDYNQAYAAVVALPAADQAALLSELSPLWDKVATKDVTDVLKTMEALAKNKDLKNYYDLYTMIEKTVSLPRNQQYLMGELTSWGKSAVFTPDVVTATDAVIKAYTDKTPASIAAAKDAAAKVTNAGSLAWLNTEIANASKAVPVAVSSVTAKTSASLSVKFNKAVDDTSKVTIGVKRADSPLTVTTTWNTDKTEATLTYSANLPEGTYSVSVKNDTTDLGITTVAVVKQKVAKIELLGDTVGVAPNSGSTPGQGYASYRVYDQYGVDITDSSLASSSNITWSSSIGTVEAKKGLLTITSFSSTVYLTQYSTAVITAVCGDSAVSASSSVKVSLSQGTLSDLQLKTLQNANNKELRDGETLENFYLDYSAVDLSGNVTSNFNLIKQGLISSQTGSDVYLFSSNPNLIKAVLVQDPTDSNKAVIQVNVQPQDTPIYTDTPVTITAMTRTGKSSTINLTVKKAVQLDSLTLMTPSQEVASGDTNIEIPFVAYDQNGNQLTKFTDITKYGAITSHDGLELVENVDGTMKIQIPSIGDEGTYVYQVVTKSGKSSMITIKVQKTVKPETLKVDTTKIKQYMQLGAFQKLDFGADAGGLTLLDQYGRTIDATNGTVFDGHRYTVRSTTGSVITNYVPENDATSPIAAATNFGEAFDGNQLSIYANALGTQTVVFTVYKDGVATDITRSVQFTVVKDSDIVDFQSDAVATLYAVTQTAINAGQFGNDTPNVYGKVSNGSLVKLAETSIIKRSVDNTNFILSGTDDWNLGYATIKAKQLPDGVTEVNGTLSTTVLVDGKYKTVTTPVKATSAEPVVQTIKVSTTTDVATAVGAPVGTAIDSFPGNWNGLKVNGDTIYATVNAVNNVLNNKSMFRFDPTTGSTSARGKVYFYNYDQYGKRGVAFSYTSITAADGNTGTYAFNNSTGVFTATNATAGDTFQITVVAPNGLLKTMKFIVQ